MDFAPGLLLCRKGPNRPAKEGLEEGLREIDRRKLEVDRARERYVASLKRFYFIQGALLTCLIVLLLVVLGLFTPPAMIK